MPDQRSPEAQLYRWLYGTAQWTTLRLEQLRKQPLCERCDKAGRMAIATVVNHKTPHKGDRRLFFCRDNLESVCAPCHDGPIQREERLGYSPEVDADGWPVDPRHRSNR